MQTTDIVRSDQGEVYTTSLVIADLYNKRHKNVLRDIRELVEKYELLKLNFKPQSYQQVMKSGGVVEQPYFIITKDGALSLAMRYSSYRLSFEIMQTLLKAFNEKTEIINAASFIVESLRKENRELKDKLYKANSRIEAAEEFISDPKRLAVFTIKKLLKSSPAFAIEPTDISNDRLLPSAEHNVSYSTEKNGISIEVHRNGILTKDLATSMKMTIPAMKVMLKKYGIIFTTSFGMVDRIHDYMVRKGDTIIRTPSGKYIKRQDYYWTKEGESDVRKIYESFNGRDDNGSVKQQTA